MERWNRDALCGLVSVVNQLIGLSDQAELKNFTTRKYKDENLYLQLGRLSRTAAKTCSDHHNCSFGLKQPLMWHLMPWIHPIISVTIYTCALGNRTMMKVKTWFSTSPSALNCAKIAEYCGAHRSLLCSVIAFTVTANEIAANSIRRLFCLLLTEKRRKWPLPWQRKEKIGHAVVIFLPTACLPCWQPTADLPQQQISHSSFC